MARWTNTTTYPNLASPDDLDIMPIADSSAVAGSQQRTIQWSQIRSLVSGVGVVSTLAPSHLADDTQGYRVGSLWYRTTTDALYVCLDDTSNAAVWEIIVEGGGSGGGGALADLSDVDFTNSPGYSASASGTTAARDLLYYNGSSWVGGRPLRGIWYRPSATLNLGLADHDAFVYSDGDNVTFPHDCPTGYKFTVFVAQGTGAITVSKNGATNLSFVSSGFVAGGVNTVTLPERSVVTFTRIPGDSVSMHVTPTNANVKQSFIIACSDETTALTTGTAKATFRMPYAFTLTAVRASVTTAPTGSVLTVDINEGGTSILSTKLTIDATEKTSTTAATAAVISDTSLADDAEITIDIDGVGSTVAGAGLKVTLIGYAT